MGGVGMSATDAESPEQPPAAVEPVTAEPIVTDGAGPAQESDPATAVGQMDEVAARIAPSAGTLDASSLHLPGSDIIHDRLTEHFTPEYFRNTRAHYEGIAAARTAAAERVTMEDYAGRKITSPGDFGRSETDPAILGVRERLFSQGDPDVRRQAREDWGREIMRLTELGYGSQMDRLVERVFGLPEYRYHGLSPEEKPRQQFDGLSPTLAEQPNIATPEPSRMIYLTPVLKALNLTDKDVLFDIGSGIGKAGLLAGTVTPVETVIGLEREPEYANYANGRARGLGLRHVHFFAQDVFKGDLSQGTAFYFYNPFVSLHPRPQRPSAERDPVGMLAKILSELGAQKPIQIAVYGPDMQTCLQESGVFTAETVLEMPRKQGGQNVWTVFRSR
jgi:hypothetical protein